MNPSGPFKACPTCGQTAAPDAAFCSRCGYSYTTAYAPPPNQTQFYQAPPVSGYPRPADQPDSTKLIVVLLLWFFLGGLGAHRIYLGHTGTGVIMILCSLVGVLTLWIVIGLIPLVAVSVWWLIDLFLIITGSLRPLDGTRLV